MPITPDAGTGLRDVLLAAPFVSIGAAVAFGAVVSDPNGMAELTGAAAPHASLLLYVDLLAVVVVTLGVWSRRKFAAPTGLPSMIALFLGFLPGMTLASYDSYSLTKVVQLLTVTPLTVFGAMIVFDRRSRRIGALWALAIIGVTAAVVALVRPDPLAQIDNAIALPGNATIATAWLIGDGIVSLWCLALLNPRWRIRFAVTGLLMTVPLLRTGSRGPTVALVLAVAVFAAMRTRGRRRWTRVFATLAIAAGALAFTLPLLPSDLSDKFDVFQGGPLDLSSESRLALFRIAARAIVHRPLGLGWGNFAALVPGGVVTDIGDDQGRLYPHNLVFEIGAEGGWVALLGLVVLVVALVRAMRMGSDESTVVVVVALLTFAFVNSLFSSDVNGNILVWVLAGVVLSSQRRFTPQTWTEASAACGPGQVSVVTE